MFVVVITIIISLTQYIVALTNKFLGAHLGIKYSFQILLGFAEKGRCRIEYMYKITSITSYVCVCVCVCSL